MTNAIYPCLWFDGQAKDAATLYATAFDDTHITSENPVTVMLSAAGQRFLCLNGGPQYKPNPSVSFYVVLESEAALDKAWHTLIEGGAALMELGKYPWSEKYGWLHDRFGITWQLTLGKVADIGQQFTPALMFTGSQAGKAEGAIQFYTSVFEHSSLLRLARYEAGEGDTEGLVKHAQFRLGNSVFIAMDSSHPHGFSFNEALSFVVECATQEEIDHYWNRLSEAGSEGPCGWLKDRYGVSWQVVPAIMGQLMSKPQQSGKVMQALLKMKKLDIGQLIAASEA